MAAPPFGTVPPPMPAPGYYAPPPAPKRPVGVTILAILAILFGVLGLLLGLLALAAAAIISTLAPSLAPYATLILVVALLLTLSSLLWIIAGIGLLKLKMWGWWLAAIGSILSIVQGISAVAYPPNQPGYFGIGLGLLILIYLVVVRKSFVAPRPAGM